MILYDRDGCIRSYCSYSLAETEPLFDTKLEIMVISRPMSGALLNGIFYTHVSSLAVELNEIQKANTRNCFVPN